MLRRSFDTGLHVLVLVVKTDEGYVVKSCVDQNTPRGIVQCEGEVSTFPEVVELVRTSTLQWDEPLHNDGAAKPHPPGPFYYIDTAGKMLGPASREELFVLLGTGVIDWDTQVWEGRWVPILKALGFPPVP